MDNINIYWNEFKNSGSVKDYLTYKQLSDLSLYNNLEQDKDLTEENKDKLWNL